MVMMVGDESCSDTHSDDDDIGLDGRSYISCVVFSEAQVDRPYNDPDLEPTSATFLGIHADVMENPWVYEDTRSSEESAPLMYLGNPWEDPVSTTDLDVAG